MSTKLFGMESFQTGGGSNLGITSLQRQFVSFEHLFKYFLLHFPICCFLSSRISVRFGWQKCIFYSVFLLHLFSFPLFYQLSNSNVLLEKVMFLLFFLSHSFSFRLVFYQLGNFNVLPEKVVFILPVPFFIHFLFCCFWSE